MGRFLLFVFALSMIERFFALHPRRFRRDRWRTDALHLLLNNILISAGLVVALVGLIVALRPAVSPELQGWVTSQPAWLQFVEAVAKIRHRGLPGGRGDADAPASGARVGCSS